MPMFIRSTGSESYHPRRRGGKGRYPGALRRARPNLEALEDRCLLSQTATTVSEQEPNNTPATAQPLTADVSVDASLSEGDVDYYSVQADAGAQVTVQVAWRGGMKAASQKQEIDAFGNLIPHTEYFGRGEITNPFVVVLDPASPGSDGAPAILSTNGTEQGGNTPLPFDPSQTVFTPGGHHSAQVFTAPHAGTYLVQVYDDKLPNEVITGVGAYNLQVSQVASPAVSQPTLVVSKPTLRPGGVDVTYEVQGADLPRRVPLALYFVSGNGTPELAESLFTPDLTVGTHTISLTAAQLGPIPADATQLEVLPDPMNEVPEVDKNPSLALTDIQVVPPTVTVAVSPGQPGLGRDYDVRATITNHERRAVSFTLNWNETYVEGPTPREPPRSNQAIPVGLQPGESMTIDLGTFNHKWQWLDPTNPIGAGDTLEKMYGAAGKETLKGLLDSLWRDAGDVSVGYFAGLDLVDKLKELLAAEPTTTVNYSAAVSLPLGNNTPVGASKNAVIEVTPDKRIAFYNYVLESVAASGLLTAAIADAPAVPLAIALGVGGLAVMARAGVNYNQAVDPPDSNYTQLVAPRTRNVPELDAQPDGFLKDFARAELELEGLKDAEATSRNRAQGAAAAGDAFWESRQQLAVARFAAQQIPIEARLAALAPQLEKTLASLQPSAGGVAAALQSQGLPPLWVRLLTERGWSAAELNGLRQNLINLGPAALADPRLVTAALRFSLDGSAAAAQAAGQRAAELHAAPQGQQVQGVSADALQGLATARAALEKARAQQPLPPGTGDQVRAFLDRLNDLLTRTNNASALQDDLAFGYSALAAVTQETVRALASSSARTIGIFDPGSGTWYLRTQNAAGAPDIHSFAYGGPGWKPVAGDWTGAGQSAVGVVDPATATWYLRNSNTAGPADVTPFRYGAPGWVPVVGDWDGDGKTSIGVFDPATATWYLKNSDSPGAPDVAPFRYGAPGWVPVVGDWDGDGKTSIGVFDPATATWYLRNEVSPGGPDAGVFRYGGAGWTPVVGDWDGNGTTTVAVLDPGGNWYLRNSNATGGPDVARFAYGMGRWLPVAGNWQVPQSPAGGGGSNPGGPLSQDQLQATVAAALTRLSRDGADPGVLQQLTAVRFEVGATPAGMLSLNAPGETRVTFSANAAGQSWFVDPTPLTDEEFAGGTARSDSAAAGRIDLLTVVLQEMGQFAGLADMDVIAAPAAPGVRRADAIAAVFARAAGS